MPRAFQSKAFFSSDNTDGRFVVDEKGNTTLMGVTLMEVGKLACFQSRQPDGTMKVRQVMIKPAHVDALLSFAGSITPVHLAHDYHGKTDPIVAQAGGIVNPRRDSGKAICNLKVAPQHAEQVLWNAREMPQHMMLSPVFNFNPEDPECIPTSFDAADLVEAGAGTTALWTALLAESENPESKSMTPEEFCTQLDDPKVKAMIQGMITGHTKAEGEMEDAAADGAESASGVMDEDKKDEEKQAPALMAAVKAKRPGARMALASLRINKATARLSKKVLTEDQIKLLVKASAVGSIGNQTALLAAFPTVQVDDTPAKAFMGKIKMQIDAGASESVAIARARKDAIAGGRMSELEAWEKANRPLP